MDSGKLTQKLDAVAAAYKRLYAAPKILLIDDDEMVCALFRATFNRLNFVLTCKATVAESIATLNVENFSLILLDWRLRGVETGQEIIDYLVANKRDIPVAILTGFGTDVVPVGGNVVAAFAKPLSIEHFEQLLNFIKLK